MRIPHLPSLLAIAFLVAATVVVLPRAARSQINASPSWIAVGVSASGSSSTAWFHEPSSRQAVACRTVESQGSLSSVQCVAGKLP
jgi:hypothetical protein